MANKSREWSPLNVPNYGKLMERWFKVASHIFSDNGNGDSAAYSEDWENELAELNRQLDPFGCFENNTQQRLKYWEGVVT